MEFSFDRSKDAHLEKPGENGPSLTPPHLDPDAADPKAEANDRLRKAIERNRAKQAARVATSGPKFQASPPPPPPFQEPLPHQEPPPLRPASLRATPTVSRHSVARPEDTEFVPVKRISRKVTSQVNYATSSSAAKKKSKPIDPKYANYLVKGCWLFCGFMILRLIFASGGVVDFYSQKASVHDRLAELAQIKKENMQLVRDIERMKTDVGFQKKLVRDNLGFIASDEFLILFPKGK